MSDEYEFYVNAGHAEYMPSPRCLTVWTAVYDPFGDETYEPDQTPQMVQAAIDSGQLPASYGVGGMTDWDPTFQAIYRVQGKLAAHVADLVDFLRNDVDVIPSGDDDTYDYWPSGARLAYDWALRIREAGGPDYTSEVAETVARVAAEVNLELDHVGLPDR